MCLLDQTELQTASPRRAALSPLSPAALSLSSQSGSCVWIGRRYWRSVPCSRRIRSWCPENRAADVKATSTNSFSLILGVCKTVVPVWSPRCSCWGSWGNSLSSFWAEQSNNEHESLKTHHINQSVYTHRAPIYWVRLHIFIGHTGVRHSAGRLEKNVKKYSCYGNFFCMRCDLNQDKHFSADVFLLLTIIYIPCQEITYIRNYHQCIHCKKLFWSPVVSKSIFPFHKIQIQVE